jgi:hypothetical protein
VLFFFALAYKATEAKITDLQMEVSIELIGKANLLMRGPHQE